MSHVGRRPSCFMEAATGERIVAFGRVGKPLENPFCRPFWISLDARMTGMQRILKLNSLRL